MTPIETVYEAFLAKINDDEWVYWSENDTKRDLKQIFDAALPLFKFPKKDMTLESESVTENVEGKEGVVYYNYKFVSDLSNDEIQILACYMKCEWLNRSILTWERIKPQYEERDFSEANMLDKLYSALESEQREAKKREAIYYRAINRKPFDYTKLAGDKNG
jgi:hypothetical protein